MVMGSTYICWPQKHKLKSIESSYKHTSQHVFVLILIILFLDFVHSRELLFQENMTNLYELITKLFLFIRNKKFCYFFYSPYLCYYVHIGYQPSWARYFACLNFNHIGCCSFNSVIRLEQMALVGYLMLIADISMFG
jgi:hypothetical protein